MTDIREEPQFDIRHLLLHFHFLPQTVIDTHDINRQTDDQHQDNSIQHKCPPCQPPRTLYVDHQLLLIIHITAFAIGRTHTEDILAVPQITIGHATYIPRIFPLGVDILHLIGIENLVRSDIIHRCVLNGHIAAILDIDRISFQLLLLHLHTRDIHRRNGIGTTDQRGIKRTVSVRVTKENYPVGRTQCFGFREIRVFLTVQRIVIIEITGLQIQLRDITLGTEP